MSTQSNKSPDFIIIIGFIIQPFTLNSSFVQTAVFTLSDPHTHSHTHWEHYFLQGHGTTFPLWVSSAWTPLRPLRTSGWLLLVLYIFTVLRLTHFFSFFFFRPVQKMENMCQPVQTHPPVICPPQTLHCRLHYFSALGNIRLVEWGKYTINISFLALFFFSFCFCTNITLRCVFFLFFSPWHNECWETFLSPDH